MSKQETEKIRVDDADRFVVSDPTGVLREVNAGNGKEDFLSESPENCRELEDQFAGLFDYLHSVADPRSISLEELLRKAVDEEKKFAEWKRSERPLKNMRLFHKINGALIPIVQQYQMSLFDSLEGTVSLEMMEDSQFEVWHCDENHRPHFPLYRIALSKICKTGKLVVNEKLRDDCWLKIQAERQNDFVFFTVSKPDLKRKYALGGWVESFIAEQREMLKQKLTPKFAFQLLCVTVIFCAVSVLHTVQAKAMEFAPTYILVSWEAAESERARKGINEFAPSCILGNGISGIFTKCDADKKN